MYLLWDLVWFLCLWKLVFVFDLDFVFMMLLFFIDVMLVFDMVGEW